MRKTKATVLAEDISTLTEYIEFGNQLAQQLYDRWGFSGLYQLNERSDDGGKSLNAPRALHQLEMLQVAYKQVEGDAVGEGFEGAIDG